MRAPPPSLPGARRSDYRTPGLHIEWREETLREQSDLPTGVPAFVGFVQGSAVAAQAWRTRGFDRWEQFENAFGAAGTSDLLALAVRGFFENGGERCVVVPVFTDPGAPGSADPDVQAMQLARRLAEPFAAGGTLEDVEDIDLICVPDAMTPAIRVSDQWVLDVQQQAVAHCERMGERFAILDAMPARSDDESRDASSPSSGGLRSSLSGAISQWQLLPGTHGALYFPWIRVRSRSGNRDLRATVFVPPCGHIAGVYARSDRRTGVHKAPANELLEGALDIGVNLTDAEQAHLNQAGINCLRERPGWGIRVWGARTLSDHPESRYVNVTRVMLTLRRWLEHNLRDLVFEPHDPALWAAIEERVSGYLRGLYRDGALKGHDTSEAFFVKCNAETNSVEGRDAGTVFAVAGLAIVVPAEFVIVRITQSANGVTVSGPATQV